MSINEDLEKLRSDVASSILDAKNSEALEKIRVATLGKSGTLTSYLRNMSNVAKEERAEVGKLVNSVRQFVEGEFDAKFSELKDMELASKIQSDSIDETLSVRVI